MAEKIQVMDKSGMHRALARIAHEILENNLDAQDAVLIGIQRRGVTLAQRVATEIKKAEDVRVPLGILDITFYRDDLSLLAEHPLMKGTDIPFAIDGKTVVLVDDVLFTGRTVRAAIEAIMDMGRPKRIQLAVLVDRGHRELPIRADFVGRNIPTAVTESVEVQVLEVDGEDGVYILKSQT